MNERVLQAKQEDWKPRPCVYCNFGGHKLFECDKIKGITYRRKYLSTQKLCYSCTGPNHKASECRSTTRCQQCKTGLHHTSICDKNSTQLLLATGKGAVVYPVVIIEIEGVKCRALLDTGAGSTYASATLIDILNRKPDRTKKKRIEMMMATTS